MQLCRPLEEVMAGEARKPGSVPRTGYPDRGDDHSSRTAVADGLKQPDPGASDGPPYNAPLFGLAPDGVYRASDVTAGTGELLPHPFTLTHLRQRLRWAVYSLWHFPWGRPRSPLRTILPCGARTFLPSLRTGDHLGLFHHIVKCPTGLPARKAAGCNADSSECPAPGTGC